MREYDPTQITVSFAGIVAGGFADGSFVTVANESDAFSDVVGTDGEVSRARSSDRRATVTIKLMQTSPTNDLFSAVATADEDTPGGAGVGALVIRDRNGTTVYRADEAWIQKRPDADFDRTVGPREWAIRCANLRRVDGSN